jgi:hypothetical protein
MFPLLKWGANPNVLFGESSNVLFVLFVLLYVVCYKYKTTLF